MLTRLNLANIFMNEDGRENVQRGIDCLKEAKDWMKNLTEAVKKAGGMDKPFVSRKVVFDDYYLKIQQPSVWKNLVVRGLLQIIADVTKIENQ